ncbi:MAG: hypothetical protein MUQ10_13100 [Anaerolineae bacterium]|nr:hypothetical protein [Anaerolineae bacterium]
MNEKKDWMDDNIADLIRASFAEDARPTSQTRESALHELRAVLRAKRGDGHFPDSVVAILGGTLFATAANVAYAMTAAGRTLTDNPAFLAVGMWMVLNLAALPVSSIIILSRRQHV